MATIKMLGLTDGYNVPSNPNDEDNSLNLNAIIVVVIKTLNATTIFQPKNEKERANIALVGENIVANRNG